MGVLLLQETKLFEAQINFGQFVVDNRIAWVQSLTFQQEVNCPYRSSLYPFAFNASKNFLENSSLYSSKIKPAGTFLPLLTHFPWAQNKLGLNIIQAKKKYAKVFNSYLKYCLPNERHTNNPYGKNYSKVIIVPYYQLSRKYRQKELVHLKFNGITLDYSLVFDNGDFILPLYCQKPSLSPLSFLIAPSTSFHAALSCWPMTKLGQIRSPFSMVNASLERFIRITPTFPSDNPHSIVPGHSIR